MTCATFEQLFVLAYPHPSDIDPGMARVHLESGCTDCRSALDQLEETLAAMPGRHLTVPPDWLSNQAKTLYAWHRTRPRDIGNRPIPAILILDTQADGPLRGFRSVGSLSRQMLYRAGHYNINLSMNSFLEDRTLEVMGQPTSLVTGLNDVAGASVELLRESDVVSSTRGNEFGAFILERVPEGIYDLQIKLTDADLDIFGLNLTLGVQPCP